MSEIIEQTVCPEFWVAKRSLLQFTIKNKKTGEREQITSPDLSFVKHPHEIVARGYGKVVCLLLRHRIERQLWERLIINLIWSKYFQ